jgi:predicted nucleotidyltransferase
MKPSEAILGKTDQIKKVIESYGFIKPRIFGSTVRKTDKEGSDLDIIAVIPSGMEGKISLFEIMDMESELEKLIGVSVDFNIENNMPEKIRKHVDSGALSL